MILVDRHDRRQLNSGQMQNIFLSMTFLVTDLSRCYTSCRSTYIPWILLTQLDLVPKVLKVLVFMSNSHTYPRGWTPTWEIHCDCLYGKSHPGEGKDKGKVFPSGLPPPPGHERTTSSQTRWSVPLICHPWDRHFFLMDSSTPHWPRKLRNLHLTRLRVCLIDGKIYLLDIFACLPAHHCLSCHFHFLHKLHYSPSQRFRVIITCC